MSVTRHKVLICDDSPLLRQVLKDMLSDGGLDVVGEITDGADLVAAVKRLKPDVVTLDVEMPRKDGISALDDLMKECPTPVVMVSTLTGRGTRETVRALSIGAVDVVQKPALRLTPKAWGVTRDELVAKVITAALARVGHLRQTAVSPRPVTRPHAVNTELASRAVGTGAPLVIIATSTGGPRALHELVPRLPGSLGAGVLIVQHMPVGFTKSLAERLNGESALAVREARNGDAIRPDTALVAPAGSHLEVTGPGEVRLSNAPAIGGLRPRADVTISSAVKNAGRPILLTVLTGMGADGLEGAKDLKRAGAGRILTEDERTCVIYGMPRAIVDAGLSDGTFPLDAMHLAMVEAAGRAQKRAA